MDSTTPLKPQPPSTTMETTAVSTPDRVNPPPRFGSSRFGPDQFLNSDKSASFMPEKCKMLCNFFDSMVNSIRLLRLKRSQPTFTKICYNIESLTKRRFTVHHLAQLKHIMPEVIAVKKILVQDEESKCMKEEFLISLETDSVEVDQNKQVNSRFSHLKEMFRSRVATFYATHPEVDEVPEGELPHLFYMKKEPESPTNETSTSMSISHISPSFKRRFSSRASSTSAIEQFSDMPSSHVLETPTKGTFINVDQDISLCKIKGTPAEAVLTPSKLMVATPALRPQKRSLMSPDHVDNELPTKSAKRRSLTFDESRCDIDDQPVHVGDDNDVQSYSVSKDVSNVLPNDHLHSLMDKERKILKEQDSIVSQTTKRQKSMAGVPKLFDMIHLLFQSVGRSVITRQELIHKIIAAGLDIIDRGELEEQLKLLQEIAPEYLSELTSLSGDTFLRLNKLSCPNSIRAKLLESKCEIDQIF